MLRGEELSERGVDLPRRGGKSSFSIAVICTTRRRISANASTKHGAERGDLVRRSHRDPVLWREELAQRGVGLPRRGLRGSGERERGERERRERERRETEEREREERGRERRERGERERREREESEKTGYEPFPPHAAPYTRLYRGVWSFRRGPLGRSKSRAAG